MFYLKLNTFNLQFRLKSTNTFNVPFFTRVILNIPHGIYT